MFFGYMVETGGSGECWKLRPELLFFWPLNLTIINPKKIVVAQFSKRVMANNCKNLAKKKKNKAGR
jgi:hypothetical protein